MEKIEIKFEQFVASLMVLYSTKISEDEIARFMGMFFSNRYISDKYEYIESPLNYLKEFIGKEDTSYALKNDYNLNTDIGKVLWNKPCTIEEYLVIVSGQSFFNDMYLIVNKSKGEPQRKDDLLDNQYIKRLVNFYGK